MKRLAAIASLLFYACSLAGQSLTLSLNPASLQAGQNTTLTAAYQDATPSASAAGIEWQLTLPTGVTAGAPVVGAAATAANKVVTCGVAGCIVIGDGATLNDTAIGSGVLAAIPLTLSAGAVSGGVSMTALGVTATNPSSISMMVNPATLTVLSPYDLNGDGAVNAADVSIMINEFLSGTCTGQSLKVADGKCGIVAVEYEILAAIGVAP
jgi:hypothetical protein